MKDTVLYRSNLLPSRDLAPAFCCAVPQPDSCPRNAPGHTVLCDPELFSGCGYATHDEAAILEHIARATFAIPHLKDRHWLEIGTHTGWTAAHIALSGHRVLGLDPEYRWAGHNHTARPEAFLARATDNLRRAGVLDRVTLAGMRSDELLANPGMYAKPEHQFAGVFIDGDHGPGGPLKDAQIAEKFVHPDGVIVFHDVVGNPIQEGVDYLAEKGWNVRIYRTPQLLAVCWRVGSPVVPPTHVHDPDFDWGSFLKSVLGPRRSDNS